MMLNTEEYIQRYSGILTKFCIHLCHNRDDAEDLFQETWYKAIKNIKKYDDSKPFEKWLMAICANTYIDLSRSANSKRSVKFCTDEEKERFIGSISDKAQIDDSYIELHSAISNLPQKLKLTLTMYYFNGYSVKEIASLLKIPEGTVKSRLNRARKCIERSLNNERK